MRSWNRAADWLRPALAPAVAGEGAEPVMGSKGPQASPQYAYKTVKGKGMGSK